MTGPMESYSKGPDVHAHSSSRQNTLQGGAGYLVHLLSAKHMMLQPVCESLTEKDLRLLPCADTR